MNVSPLKIAIGSSISGSEPPDAPSDLVITFFWDAIWQFVLRSSLNLSFPEQVNDLLLPGRSDHF